MLALPLRYSHQGGHDRTLIVRYQHTNPAMGARSAYLIIARQYDAQSAASPPCRVSMFTMHGGGFEISYRGHLEYWTNVSQTAHVAKNVSLQRTYVACLSLTTLNRDAP